MGHVPTPRAAAERDAAQHTLVTLAGKVSGIDDTLRFARLGWRAIPDRGAQALTVLALAHVLADLILANRWRWVLDALDDGERLPAIAAAAGLDVDEVAAGARVWIDAAAADGTLTEAYARDAQVRLLEDLVEHHEAPGGASDVAASRYLRFQS